MKGFVLASVFLLSSASALPQAPQSTLDFPRFRLVKGTIDSDGISPSSGAQLCLLSAARTCFRMPPSPATATRRAGFFQFGLEPRAERLPLSGGGSVIFFSGQFYGGGSGTLDRLALLRLEHDGRISNLLPYLGVTNVSNHAMWNLPAISKWPVLVTADFIWGEDETHLAAHFYDVDAYWYSEREDRYVKAIEYVTSRKYPGPDTVDYVTVLKPERAEIERRLRLALTP